jgi:predicted esterase
MKRILLFLSCLLVPVSRAEDRKPLEVPLWTGNPPDMVEGATPGADDGTGRWRNVGIPGMLVYLPETPAPEGGRIALIACPGGGYTHLTRLVGADGAVDAFLPKNVAVISLKYRTRGPSTAVDDDALADGKRAVRLIRHRAKEWGIHPGKIGMVGWSAGANLSLNVASRWDQGDAASADPVERLGSRPDFVVLLSPWPSKKAVADYPIRPGSPPAFIASAEDDRTAPADFARGIATAYEVSRSSCHLWVVKEGGHGAFTINAPGEGGKWIDRFWPWLGGLGIRP